MAPKLEPKQRARKAGSDKAGSKSLDKSVPPSDTWDPAAKPYKNDQKAANDFFQRELELKEEEHLKDMNRTTAVINKEVKNSDRIKKRQRFEYGMTLDEIENMRIEIDTIKIQNDKLYGEMEYSKDISQKLEKELADTKRRYAETIEHMNKLKRESKTWQDTKDKLLKTEARVHQLFTSNRKLRTVLLKHKVDPTLDPREIPFRVHSGDGGSTSRSVKSNKTFPREHKQRRPIVKDRRYSAIGELDDLRKLKREEMKQNYGFLDGVFNQMNPAYFGFYTRRNKPVVQQKENVRSGVIHPRVNLPPLVKGYY